MILSIESIADIERFGEQMAKTQKKPPVQEVRLGRIKGLVWENETQNGIRFSVTIVRLYKDEDQWHETTSFDRDDLPLVAKVADRLHTFILEHIAESRQQDAA